MREIAETAQVSPTCKLGNNVRIGDFCVVDPGTSIGSGCQLGIGVRVKRGAAIGDRNVIHDGAVIHGATRLGDGNSIHENCVIGGQPLVRNPSSVVGRLEIGSENTIRELCTIQLATEVEEATRIGDRNFIMPSVQIGHDCQIGSDTTMTNNVALCGHVLVENRVTLGIGAKVHQYCRIGEQAMVGASAYVSQDVLPFVLIDGRSGGVVGLNVVGLRRNGFTRNEVSILKTAYGTIFRRGLCLAEIEACLACDLGHPLVLQMLEFLRASKRGFARERGGSPPNALLREERTAIRLYNPVADAA